MKKIRGITSLLMVSVLVVALMVQSKTSATVPGVNSLVSVNSSGTGSGNHQSGNFNSPAYISGDGRYVAFGSSATNLVSGVSTGGAIYVRDLSSGTTGILGTRSSGSPIGGNVNGISRTGRYVLFWSTQTDIISGKTVSSTYRQLYLRDTSLNTTYLLSQDSSGNTANAHVQGLNVSSDGRFVLFITGATNLGPSVTNTGWNLYMLDRSTDTFTILNKATNGSLPNSVNVAPYGHMSCDGSLVVFQSGNDLAGVSSTHVDIFLLDLRSGNKLTDLTASSNAAALAPNISCNGDYIGFLSKATNLDTSISDTSMNNYHLFSYDRTSDVFTVLDQNTSGTAGNQGVVPPLTSDWGIQYMALSDQGDAVFHSLATNLVTGVTGSQHVYFRNVGAGTTELLDQNTSGGEPNNSSWAPTVTSDGKKAAYISKATDLVSLTDTNNYEDTFTSETGL